MQDFGQQAYVREIWEVTYFNKNKQNYLKTKHIRFSYKNRTITHVVLY